MKLKIAISTLLLTLSFSLLAKTEQEVTIPLTMDEILGSWSVDAESIHRNGQDSRHLETVWTFNADGTMVGISTDSKQHARIGKMRAVISYKIEHGVMIKQAAPGRSKLETCTAVEKSPPRMVLKCTSVYFFMSKL